MWIDSAYITINDNYHLYSRAFILGPTPAMLLSPPLKPAPLEGLRWIQEMGALNFPS